MAERFPEKFYKQDTVTVAKRLLGQRLVHIVNGKRLSGIIVETEAYLGGIDAAAHTFGFRRTNRVQSMWKHGGHAYVFFVYGMHFCFNVVTRTEDHPEAVLIRALQPDENIELQLKRRKVKRIEDIANGPAKLCDALKINKSCDGLSLAQPPLFIERARTRFLKDEDIVSSPRIGVDYAGTHAAWPLRFSIGGNLFVSKPWPLQSKSSVRKKQRSLI